MFKWKEKHQKSDATFRKQVSDRSASVYLLMCCLLLLGKVAVWRLCQAGVRMKWQCLYAPRSFLRHVWAIWVCLVGRKRRVGGWGAGRGRDDRVTGWVIICVEHLSPNNTQTLDHRGGNRERDRGTQRDIKSKSETRGRAEGGGRETAQRQGLKGGVWAVGKKVKWRWQKPLWKNRGNIRRHSRCKRLCTSPECVSACTLCPSACVSTVKKGRVIFLS